MGLICSLVHHERPDRATIAVAVGGWAHCRRDLL